MANVEDFTCPEFPEDLFKSIFEHQHELAIKYIPIEEKNGLCLYSKIPADLDNSKAQARIKDMSWRAVEEVAEAYEALDKNENVHFLEELADALHFLVEKYLLCGFYPKDSLQQYFSRVIYKPYGCTDIISLVGFFMVDCGLSCNCLKNKPWKQSQMMTDTEKFLKLLDKELTSFIVLCRYAGFETAEELYSMYMRKNQVNQFRQRSNY